MAWFRAETSSAVMQIGATCTGLRDCRDRNPAQCNKCNNPIGVAHVNRCAPDATRQRGYLTGRILHLDAHEPLANRLA